MSSIGVSALTIAVALLASAGCTTKMKFSSRALCENAGGKYQQGICEPGTPKGAVSMCEAHGGIYLMGEDNCIIFEK